MLIIAYTLLVMDICALTTLAPQLDDSSVVGGVDGCLVDSAGEPVLAVITISGAARLTGTDGCFFFPNLQPGIHNMTITLSDKTEVRHAVRISRGRATAMGSILIEP
jgi:hypothetical protein